MKKRKIIAFISFFLLPITLNYFSPVLLVQSSFEHTFSVMHIIYGLMLFSALFFQGAWCSYVCPFGALQDQLPDKGKTPNLLRSHFPNLKYVTGSILLLLTLVPLILYGIKKIDIFYHMEETKVTLDGMHGLILYYIITVSIIILSATLGKRIWCRYLCPMYIFNILGMKISKLLHLPSFGVTLNDHKCVNCGRCNTVCPMGLDVTNLSNSRNNENCIQCGKCVETCRVNAVKKSWHK